MAPTIFIFICIMILDYSSGQSSSSEQLSSPNKNKYSELTADVTLLNAEYLKLFDKYMKGTMSDLEFEKETASIERRIDHLILKKVPVEEIRNSYIKEIGVSTNVPSSGTLMNELREGTKTPKKESIETIINRKFQEIEKEKRPSSVENSNISVIKDDFLPNDFKATTSTSSQKKSKKNKKENASKRRGNYRKS